MKWIGQHIWDFTSRFRNDVYLETLTENFDEFTVVIGNDNKLYKSTTPSEKSKIQVRNDEGSTIPAGAPLYSKGEIGGSDRILVGICVSSDPAKMPCIGIAEFEMNTTDTKDSFAITQGVYNTNIHGFTGLSEGDILYVNGGVAPHLTQTKPTNGDLIQNVGIVLKTNGTICQGLLVSAIGRTNDVPWPLYVDHTTQRVGIGTSSPTVPFHVVGDARIQGNLTVNGTYTQIDTDVNTTEQWLVTNDGTGPAAVINQKGSEDIFDVQDDGTSVLYVKDGGNVGIGTTSPNYLLDVESSSASARVYNTAGSTGLFLTCASGYTSHINFGDNTDSNAGRIIYREYDHAMTFTTNTSEAMFIDSSQRVGIGTTSPDSKLHVAGEITAEDQINFKNFGGSLLRFTKDSWTSVPTQDLIYQGWDTTIDDYIYLKAPGNTTTTHGVALIGDGVIALGRTDAETGAPELTSAAAPLDDNWLVLNSTGATFSGGVTISDISGTRGVFRNDNAYDLRLGGGTSYTDGAYVSLSGGMRGGGTSNLKGRVEIRSGGSNYSAQADITGDVVIGTQWNGGTSDILTLDSSTGSVGIGTSSPNSTYKLHVAGKSYLSGGIQMNSGDEIDFGNSNQYITGVNDTSLTLATGGSATLTATHAGNVGIGTTSPGYRLVVNSYSADTVAKFESTDSIARLELKDDDDAAYVGTQNNKAFIGMEANATGTNNLIVTSDGKVGIGTNSPSEKLDVTGNIAVSGTVDGVDIGANYANWNTAYSWGNHASAGYLTSSSTQSKYLRSDAVDYFTGKLNWDGADYTDGINMSLGNIRDAHRIDANEFFQLASGRARNNLGDPTVTEMALFEEQFKPQTTLANDYDDLTDLTFWYQETSSSSWVEDTSYSDDQKRKFLRTNNSSVIIPNTYYKFRVEFKAKSYTFANAMYMYWSSQSHRTQVHVWKKRCSDGTWIQHTFSTNTISSWPGHGYLPFSKIAWHETNTTSANHFTHIRFEFIPTWVPYSGSGTDYSTRNINLYGMQIWGGYPTGRRTPHYYDQNGEFNFLKDAHIHDNQTLYIGTGGDLQLYHDGSNSYIDEAGTGNLKIRSNRLQLEKYTGETMAEFIADGASSLYYNNNKKFETTSTGATVTGKLSTTTGLNVVGNTSLDGDLTVNGINYGLYHATTEDGYYSDNYEGSRHLTMFIKNARADIIRYASVGNIEYWNGSSWQDGSSQLANVKKLLDGRQDTSWSVPSTYYKFRFTVSPSTAWPTRAKIGIQTSWSGSTWPGATMLVEEYDGSNWATKVTADFGGQAGGGATPLNSNDNDVDSWGLMFKADNALHTGNGNSSSYNSGLNTRITIDFYGWSPSNPSHVTIPLQNIFITSNYAGTENTDYTNLLDYDRNVAIPNAMTVAGNTTMSGRVDIQKDLRLRGTDAVASQGVVRFYVDNTNKLFIDTANDGSGFFVVDSLGRVGIGTTSPAVKLDVVGDAQLQGTAPRFVMKETGSNKDFSLRVQTDGRLSVLNDNLGSEVLVIKQDGNVGIGTTSPAYKLDVNGGGVKTTTATGNRIAYYDGSGINAYGGTSGYAISNYTGDLNIRQHTNDGDIIFQCDDGSGDIETYFFLDGSNGLTTFPDNKKLTFGNASDLRIFHDGSHSYIRDSGTGNLRIDASNFYVRNSGGTKIAIDALDGAEVALRYDGSRKLETTSTGVEVNGKIKATDINFSGLPTSSVGLSAGDVWDDNGTLKIVR